MGSLFTKLAGDGYPLSLSHSVGAVHASVNLTIDFCFYFLKIAVHEYLLLSIKPTKTSLGYSGVAAVTSSIPAMVFLVGINIIRP